MEYARWVVEGMRTTQGEGGGWGNIIYEQKREKREGLAQLDGHSNDAGDDNGDIAPGGPGISFSSEKSSHRAREKGTIL